MFFLAEASIASSTVQQLILSIRLALMLTIFIVLGVFVTLIISKLLSKTVLKGMPSSFTLELPPYRRPQFGMVIIRSIFDRTLFVLGRAIVAAAPAGILIWLLANINYDSMSLLQHATNFLNPYAYIIGLDGVILMAFLLGFPANEIVVPIIIMAYMANGTLIELGDLNQLKTLLLTNGWTWLTALSTMLFSLIHFPCATTCITIYKETQSWKWTFLAWILPTFIGILVCGVVANIARLLTGIS